MVGVLEAMPGIPGNEDRRAYFKGMALVVQDDSAVAFEHEEGLIHLEVPVDGDAGTPHHLLSAQREAVGTRGRAGFNQNPAAVSKVHELFACAGAEHIPLRRRDLKSLGSAIW